MAAKSRTKHVARRSRRQADYSLCRNSLNRLLNSCFRCHPSRRLSADFPSALFCQAKIQGFTLETGPEAGYRPEHSLSFSLWITPSYVQRTHQGDGWVRSRILQVSPSSCRERKHAHNVLTVVSDQESDFFLGGGVCRTQHPTQAPSSPASFFVQACSFNLKAPPSQRSCLPLQKIHLC